MHKFKLYMNLNIFPGTCLLALPFSELLIFLAHLLLETQCFSCSSWTLYNKSINSGGLQN